MAGEKEKWWEDEREIAELIWCAAHLHRILAPPSSREVEYRDDSRSPNGKSPVEEVSEDGKKTPSFIAEETEQRIGIATHSQKSEHSPVSSQTPESLSSDRATPIRVPDPFPLPKPAAISKALLPLAQRVPGLLANELDIDATVERMAEADGLPTLVFRPSLERWFEVHLLVDRSPSMELWGDLAEGVAALFRWQGFFRDVRVWQFATEDSEPRLFSGEERIEREIRSLIAPSRNRLFVVLTDTLGKAWYSGTAFAALAILGECHPVSIAHVFSRDLWRRTALHQAIQCPLAAPQPGCANSRLKVAARRLPKIGLYRFPIFNLSPNHFVTWANFLAGSGGNSIQGVLIKPNAPTAKVNSRPKVENQSKPNSSTTEAEHLLRTFQTDASPKARELAKVLAAIPLIPPVMRLAQQQFLPDSEHWHLAEVFFSGLLRKSVWSPQDATVLETWYEFQPGVRELLLADSSVRRTTEIWQEIGHFIERHYGSLRYFQALVPNPEGSIRDMEAKRDRYFAEVQAAVFMTWGSEYAQLARDMMASYDPSISSTGKGKRRSEPVESEDSFDVALIEGEETYEFEFDVATLKKRSRLLGWDDRWAIQKERRKASGVIEELGENIQLELMEIPAGTFLMGSPEDELERLSRESPQHEVNVPSFHIGRYPVTQEQWRIVAGWERVEQNLDPDPSYFKEDYEGQSRWQRPVERVSWLDAKEFCARLTRKTGREYRLPTEAEWEYACRGGTQTPFHFGETITTNLANYRGIDNENFHWKGNYGRGPKGEYREQTTPVGYFKVANEYGLYDMHGNAWEWCEDDWHDNYENAPTDGRAWLTGNNYNTKVLRGGSWYLNPRSCRSACRYYLNREYCSNGYVFRVVRVRA
ncbi:MAG: SAV_2336 N-terminal domain-related protein [Spirulina sp.]